MPKIMQKTTEVGLASNLPIFWLLPLIMPVKLMSGSIDNVSGVRGEEEEVGKNRTA